MAAYALNGPIDKLMGEGFSLFVDYTSANVWSGQTVHSSCHYHDSYHLTTDLAGSRSAMLKIKAPHSGLVSGSGKRAGGGHIKKCGCSNKSCGHPSLPPRLVFIQTTCNATRVPISSSAEHASQHSVSRRHLLSGIASVLIWKASPGNPLALSTASAASVPGPRSPSPEVAKALDVVLDKNITKSKVGRSHQVQYVYALHHTRLQV